MALNRDYIGAVSEPRFVQVEVGQLKLFAKAIGEKNPIHFDEKTAMDAGHCGVVAPLTFGNCLRQLAPARSPSYADLGVDFKTFSMQKKYLSIFIRFMRATDFVLSRRSRTCSRRKAGRSSLWKATHASPIHRAIYCSV